MIQADLDQFVGTEKWYRHRLTHLLYTDGVKFMAEKAGAHWLIDAIFSWQLDNRVSVHDHQFWTLTVDKEKNTAVLLAVSDALPPEGPGKVLARQEIEWTDFPMDEIDLWFANSVLYLPSEH